MKSLLSRASIAAAAAAAAAIVVAAPANADPLFGSAGSSDRGSSDSGSLSTGSVEEGITKSAPYLGALGEALKPKDNKPKHYGKLGRADAPNGVKSINVWVFAPKTAELSPGTNTYPKNSRLGVRWNSTIDAGPVVDGNECAMEIRLAGPKVPKKAQLAKTRDCTANQLYTFRSAGSYQITVTDTISGASNKINFDVR